MAPTPSLQVNYTVKNRDSTKEVGNRFHFAGGTPADQAAWQALADDVITGLYVCLSSEVTIDGWVGYPAGSDIGVASGAPNHTNGSNVPGSTQPATPGFVCALVRWETDQRTSKNHPIYLFNYIHGMLASGSASPAALEIQTAVRTALLAFAQKWWDTGFTDGTNVYRRAGPNGAVAISDVVDLYLRDHDLSPR